MQIHTLAESVLYHRCTLNLPSCTILSSEMEMFVFFTRLKIRKIYCALGWKVAIYFVKKLQLIKYFSWVQDPKSFQISTFEFISSLCHFFSSLDFWFSKNITCKSLTWPRGTAGVLSWNYTGGISLSTFWLRVYICCSNLSNHILKGFYFACVALFSSSEPLTSWMFGFSQVFRHAHEYFGIQCIWNVLRLLSTFITKFSFTIRYIDLLA